MPVGALLSRQTALWLAEKPTVMAHNLGFRMDGAD